MSSHLDGSYLGDPKFEPVMEALNHYNARVFVHPAIPKIAASIPVQIPVFAMEFTFDTTRAAFNMVFNGVMERHQDIKWILAHAGGTVPYLVDRFELLWFTDDALVARAPKGARGYLSELYYDTALSANMSALSSLGDLVTPEHILFGSDYPFAPELAMALSVGSVKELLPLDETLRSQITRSSALQLFPQVAARLAK
jgi:predicted TIM-barrel fold metal-dependent hydrolase